MHGVTLHTWIFGKQIILHKHKLIHEKISLRHKIFCPVFYIFLKVLIKPTKKTSSEEKWEENAKTKWAWPIENTGKHALKRTQHQHIGYVLLIMTQSLKNLVSFLSMTFYGTKFYSRLKSVKNSPFISLGNKSQKKHLQKRLL